MSSPDERVYNVMVIGAGGVGTMAAVALENSKRARVTAVLRSNYQTASDNGFEIDSIDHGKLAGWRPTQIVPSVEAGATSAIFDYVVVTMKNQPDIVSVPQVISRAVTADHTTIVLIQNGLGIEQPILDAFPTNVIISCVSMIGAHEHQGRVIHNDHDSLTMAYFPNPLISVDKQASSLQSFASVYGASGPTVRVVEDIVWWRWRKVMWNGTFGPLCAIAGLDSAQIRLFGGEDTLIRPAMAEIAEVAKACGYDLPEETAQEMIDSTPLELKFRPSMLVDVDKGNPTEIEVTLGSVLREAERVDMSTPLLKQIYNMLKLIQCRLLEARGLISIPNDVPKRSI